MTAGARTVRATQAVSTPVVAALLDMLWFSPRLLSPKRRHPIPAGTTPVDFPMGRISLAGYDSGGAGPTVLVVHGWGGWANQFAAFVAPLAEAGYRVVGVDLPAHGNSPRWQTNGYELAAAVTTVADSLGEVDTVIAHSMGALATARAVADGLATNRLVLVAPIPDLDTAMVGFRHRLGFSRTTERALRGRIERRFDTGVWDHFRLEPLVADLHMPGLIVHDRHDDQVPLARAAGVAAAWEAPIIETSRLGHYRILRDPDVIAGVVSWLVGRYRADEPLQPASARTSRAPEVADGPSGYVVSPVDLIQLMSGSGTEIACSLHPDRVGGRIEDWNRVLSKAQSSEAVPNGLRVTLDREIDLVELVNLVDSEQTCCSFLTFGLGVTTDRVWLEVSGPEDAHGVITAVFGRAARVADTPGRLRSGGNPGERLDEQ